MPSHALAWPVLAVAACASVSTFAKSPLCEAVALLQVSAKVVLKDGNLGAAHVVVNQSVEDAKWHNGISDGAAANCANVSASSVAIAVARTVEERQHMGATVVVASELLALPQPKQAQLLASLNGTRVVLQSPGGTVKLFTVQELKQQLIQGSLASVDKAVAKQDLARSTVSKMTASSKAGLAKTQKTRTQKSNESGAQVSKRIVDSKRSMSNATTLDSIKNNAALNDAALNAVNTAQNIFKAASASVHSALGNWSASASVHSALGNWSASASVHSAFGTWWRSHTTDVQSGVGAAASLPVVVLPTQHKSHETNTSATPSNSSEVVHVKQALRFSALRDGFNSTSAAAKKQLSKRQNAKLKRQEARRQKQEEERRQQRDRLAKRKAQRKKEQQAEAERQQERDRLAKQEKQQKKQWEAEAEKQKRKKAALERVKVLRVTPGNYQRVVSLKDTDVAVAFARRVAENQGLEIKSADRLRSMARFYGGECGAGTYSALVAELHDAAEPSACGEIWVEKASEAQDEDPEQSLIDRWAGMQERMPTWRWVSGSGRSSLHLLAEAVLATSGRNASAKKEQTSADGVGGLRFLLGGFLPSSSVGQIAELSAEGFHAVMASESTEQMDLFVRRVLAKEGLRLRNESLLKEMLPYYDGRCDSQGYDALVKELHIAQSRTAACGGRFVEAVM